MYYLAAGWFAQRAYALPVFVHWSDIIIKNLLPVTLGNIIGGGVFVGLGYSLAYRKNGAK
jgi:formate/nitrite transporter FocA (FNT family)